MKKCKDLLIQVRSSRSQAMGAFNNLTLVKVGAAERRDYLGGDGQTVAEALRIHHGLLATPLSTDGMHLFEQLLP